MKILIEISDENQAVHFLNWIKFRGDVYMGDYVDDSGIPKRSSNIRLFNVDYVYISHAYVMSAREVDKQ